VSTARSSPTPSVAANPVPASSAHFLLQRKCACGGSAGLAGECEECSRKKLGLQRKPLIGANDDPLEREADRIADQLLAVPARPSRSAAPQLVQRAHSPAAAPGQPAPQSVECALAGAGQSLQPALRREMELRFGYDFSAVRIHTGAAAARSAQDVDGLAYTLGSSIVFAASRFAPETPAGRRLLAHELTHVVQQTGPKPLGEHGSRGRPAQAPGSLLEPAARQAAAIPAGAPARLPLSTSPLGRIQRQPAGGNATGAGAGPNKAAADGVPYEKWSPQVEALYRKVGDPRADAVAKCRAEGKSACAWLLTLTEVDALYTLASESKGDEGKVRAGLGKAVPLLGFVGPSVVLKGPIQVPGLGGAGATLGGTEGVVGPAAGGAAGGGATAAAVTVGAAVAIVAVAVIAGYQLWKLGRFQETLRAKGFIILEDPLRQAICHSCHSPNAPKPGKFDFRDFPPLEPETLPQAFFRLPPSSPGPVAPPISDLRKDTAPAPQPDPRPRPRPADTDTEEESRRCRAMAVGQRGGNSCHDAFATLISGSPREWGVETPEGLYRDFDGLGVGRMLYEVKTGYGFLLNTSPATAALRERTLYQFIDQASDQQAIADRCGYDLLWVFNNRAVADLVQGYIAPPVTFQPYDCNEDR